VSIKADELSGCFLLGSLSVAFFIGGLLGGIVGGALIWWAITPLPTPVSVVALPPPPTPLSTATLQPSATATLAPTATITPFPTPSATRVLLPTPAPADVIDQVLPSVVTVINTHTDTSNFFNPAERRVTGSGFIIDSRGYIATNAHVVTSAQALKVLLADGREMVARLVVRDPANELALLKIEAEGLQPIRWGSSQDLRLGQPVMAIGSALGDFPNSVTVGIVSGLNRAIAVDQVVLYGLVQTDAAINQGNSGGPLINERGEVIGINTFVIRQDHDRGIAQGISFAIPSATAQSLTTAWIVQAAGEPIAPQLLPASQPESP
jgi:2-alkenal reductase